MGYLDYEYDSEWAICPYCKDKVGDCRQWVTDQEDKCICDECGETYIVWAEYDVTYYTKKVKPND